MLRLRVRSAYQRKLDKRKRARLVWHQLLLRPLDQWLTEHLVATTVPSQLWRPLARLVDSQRLDERLAELDKQLLPRTPGTPKVRSRKHLLQEVSQDRCDAHRLEPYGNVWLVERPR